MSKQFHLILFLSLLLNCILGKDFDPDTDICENHVFSGGIVTDEQKSYIFKGKYYWDVLSLMNIESGVSGLAKLISTQWPDITDEIRAVFLVPTPKNTNMVVFVVRNKWFGYEKGVKTMNGSTDGWPEFKSLKITTAFPQKYGNPLIFVIHSNNRKYILYKFTNMNKPLVERKGFTEMSENYFWFIDSDSSPDKRYQDSLLVLGDHYVVKAALSYPGVLVLITKDSLCFINTDRDLLEKTCRLKPFDSLLSCPLITSSTPTAPIPMITSKSNTLYEIGKTEAMRPEMSFPEDENSGPSADFSTKEMNSEASVEYMSEKERQILYSKWENSEYWGKVFIIGLIIVFIVVFLMVGGIAKVRNSRPKGNDIYIKKKSIYN